MKRDPFGGVDSRWAFEPAEVAVMLGLSASTLDLRIKDGTIPSLKIGHRRLIPRAALETLLAGTTGPEASGK